MLLSQTPPYGISFMNKKWDYDVPSTEIWRESLRILKPGGHILVACGTRTQHRMVVNIEDAGYEIRDLIVWAYGSGFPKSLNISKAIDKELGCEREVVGLKMRPDGKTAIEARPNNFKGQLKEWHRPWMEDRDKVTLQASITAPSSDLAKQYDGYGTGLKPAIELWTLARKPISEKNIALNVMKWSTGGINVDKCRVGNDSMKSGVGQGFLLHGFSSYNELIKAKNKGEIKCPDGRNIEFVIERWNNGASNYTRPDATGRFPANLIHDGSQEVLDLFPVTKTGNLNHTYKPRQGNVYGKDIARTHVSVGSEGSASRFFYCAKASSSEKNRGLPTDIKNIHPTVKPIKLMEYLVRLITPSEGTVLDPFCGSGSTLVAVINEGFNYIGIELSQEYCDIAQQRINIEIK